MVFYRKYRPQTISDLDSVQVREKLYAVLSKPDNIPHAFLFTGPKGLGKTSTARIIAKVVNCVGAPKKRGKSGIEPCNECEQCTAITNGTSMDVMEIDAASNRGIDEIRELKEKIKLSPLSAKKKVYIIDEVHMLTTEAFNALLKTLEEPPSHAMFLLCTTEPQKVPATILSRTFHIMFKKATTEELISSFKRIVDSEKIKITPEALETIAKLSDGGFRDGAKMLEEVAALAGESEITPKLIEEKFHITSSGQHIEKLCEFLVKRDTKEALLLINAIVSSGNDIRYVLEQTITVFHNALLAKAGVEVSSDLKAELSIDELKSILLLLTRALGEMKYAVVPQLPLEIAVIEMVEVADSSEEVVTEVREEKQVINGVNTTVSVTSLRKQVGNIQKIRALYGEKEEKILKGPPSPPANVSVLNFSAKGEITPEWLNEFWSCIIQNIKQHNHTLAGVLRGCMIKSFDRKNLVIETAYAFHREKLDNGKTKAILEQICTSLTGNPVSVTVELKQ